MTRKQSPGNYTALEHETNCSWGCLGESVCPVLHSAQMDPLVPETQGQHRPQVGTASPVRGLGCFFQMSHRHLLFVAQYLGRVGAGGPVDE